jgi:hypothetical protein
MRIAMSDIQITTRTLERICKATRPAGYSAGDV